jgi:hypothetical protein
MIGTSKFDVCSKDKIQVFDNQHEVLLALALRRQTSDRRIVGHERSTLDQMIDIEFCDMSNKFPQIPALRSIVMSSRNQVTEGSSRDNSRSTSRERHGPSRGSTTNGKNRNSGQHHSRSPPTKGSGGRGGVRDVSSLRRSADSSVMGGSWNDSLESGSGSIYKPPALNPAEKFGRELDLSFPQI